MRSRFLQASHRVVLVLLAACFAIAVARPDEVTHVISGTVEKVDAGAKTIAVKTADGTVETVKFTEKTTVHGNGRSEEHTSELQSHLNLVCRLLLEKKKYTMST